MGPGVLPSGVRRVVDALAQVDPAAETQPLRQAAQLAFGVVRLRKLSVRLAEQEEDPPGLVGPQDRLLREVVGVGAVEQPGAEVAVHGRVILPAELRKGRAIPRPDRQGRVGMLRLERHRRGIPGTIR